MKAQLNQLQTSVKEAIDQLGARAANTRSALRAEADRRVAAVRQVVASGKARFEGLTKEAEVAQTSVRQRAAVLAETLGGLVRHPIVQKGLAHPAVQSVLGRLPRALSRHLGVATENDATREEGAVGNG